MAWIMTRMTVPGRCLRPRIRRAGRSPPAARCAAGGCRPCACCPATRTATRGSVRRTVFLDCRRLLVRAYPRGARWGGDGQQGLNAAMECSMAASRTLHPRQGRAHRHPSRSSRHSPARSRAVSLLTRLVLRGLCHWFRITMARGSSSSNAARNPRIVRVGCAGLDMRPPGVSAPRPPGQAPHLAHPYFAPLLAPLKLTSTVCTSPVMSLSCCVCPLSFTPVCAPTSSMLLTCSTRATAAPTAAARCSVSGGRGRPRVRRIVVKGDLVRWKAIEQMTRLRGGGRDCFL